jgi:hypothetical protein
MTYDQMKHLPPGDFKRACGVHPQNFETMLQVLREHEQRGSVLDVEMIILTLGVR